MQWHYNDEIVEKEAYCWEAYYKDGTCLKQFDDDGQFHRFAEIDQSRLIVFKMVGDKTFSIPFKEGMKLIHYYDNYILHGNSDQETRFRVYCFGYEYMKGKVITKIYPNEILITDKE
jgi:hypothetical protein